jgi:hypothetical protein
MEKRFIYELLVGLVTIIAVFFFGNAGMAALSLLVAHPFIGKKKADEREHQLFNMVGSITAAVTLLACVVIYLSTDVVINGYFVGEHWLILAVGSFLIAHGASGLIIFKKA